MTSRVGSSPTSRGILVLRRLFRRPLAVLGLFLLLLFFPSAYLGPYFYHLTYKQIDYEAFLASPSANHWFGTTQNGFDLFALTMRGLQKSLIIGLIGAVLSTGIAAIAGATAGYFSGWVDRAILTLIDLLLVLPAFLIIAILSPLFNGRTWLIFVALLAGFQWMVTARVVRSMTLSIKEREFVYAARFMGVANWKIILQHIVPNMSSFLIIDATINVSSLILAEVGLSFFGFGVQPPDISLGTLINNHWQAAGTINGYQFYLPAILLVWLVLSVNMIGDGLRDALDPHTEIGTP